MTFSCVAVSLGITSSLLLFWVELGSVFVVEVGVGALSKRFTCVIWQLIEDDCISSDSTISASKSFSSINPAIFSSSPLSISFLRFNCSNKLVSVTMSSSPGGCSLHRSVNSVSEVVSVARCARNPRRDSHNRLSSSIVLLFCFRSIRGI